MSSQAPASLPEGEAAEASTRRKDSRSAEQQRRCHGSAVSHQIRNELGERSERRLPFLRIGGGILAGWPGGGDGQPGRTACGVAGGVERTEDWEWFCCK